VGQFPENIDLIIKDTLKRTNSPILLIYNHYAYWHAVLIVGYDDNKEIDGCPFVEKWKEIMTKKVEKLRQSFNSSDHERADRYEKLINKLKDRYAQLGGCQSQKGVFFVRDSIYSGPADDLYDYDPSRTGEEAPYAARVIEHSYDWLKYLGNHLVLLSKKVQ